MGRAKGVPVFFLRVSDISDLPWQKTSLWEGERGRTFKQSMVGKAVLEANLPAMATEFSDSAGIVADGIFSSPERPELSTLGIFSSLSLLLPKLLSVFTPSPSIPVTTHSGLFPTQTLSFGFATQISWFGIVSCFHVPRVVQSQTIAPAKIVPDYNTLRYGE